MFTDQTRAPRSEGAACPLIGATDEMDPDEHIALPIPEGRATLQKKVMVMVLVEVTMVMVAPMLAARGKCQ